MTAASDMTLRHSHRCALRRIERGEPVGDLGECLGALYLHDLCRDEGDRIVLSPDGRKVLEAHDAALEKTRPTPRPNPEVPAGWHIDGNSAQHRDVEHPLSLTLLRCESDESLLRHMRESAALLDLMRWEQGRRVLARLVEVRAEGEAAPA